MDKRLPLATCLVLVGSLVLGAGPAHAQGPNQGSNNASKSGCKDLPTWSALRAALRAAQSQPNGALGLEMWGTIVDRDGVVCAVAFTGAVRGDQWPGSRVISAQKANTGNEFSLPSLALSTANLYTAVQPGGSLFGLQESNPVSTDVAYSGSPSNYGRTNDGMVCGRIGGVNVFGGGLGLYNADGKLVGGIGVSGDTSCADHNVAYRTRRNLHLDFLVTAGAGGVSGDGTRRDTIVYDITPQAGQMPGTSAGGWGHPECFPEDVAASATLPANQ